MKGKPKEIILAWCDTKSCIYNKDGQCNGTSIYIEKGRCGSFKSNKYYTSDGTFKG